MTTPTRFQAEENGGNADATEGRDRREDEPSKQRMQRLTRRCHDDRFI